MPHTILSPVAILGYGINKDSLKRAGEVNEIDAIGVDAGSVDAGPHYLGSGKSFVDLNNMRRDLKLLLEFREEVGAPLLVGTAGTAGSKEHVNMVEKLLREISKEQSLNFNYSKIYSDIDKDVVVEGLQSGRLDTNEGREPDVSDIERSSNIVAQIGPKPYIEALSQGADVVLGGRSVDIAPFCATPMMNDIDEGLAMHLAKLLECASKPTNIKSGVDCLVGHLYDDYFEVEPPNQEIKCTTETVAAHTLHEKADPHFIYMPSGTTDISNAEFEQVTEERVRVSGAKYSENESPTLMIEGSASNGFRTIVPAGTNDSIVIDQLDDLYSRIENAVEKNVDENSDSYTINFRTYGKNHVSLYNSENLPNTDEPPEIGIILDVVGERQEIANSVASFARTRLLHQDFDRKNMGANVALPYSPSDIEVGEVFNFSVYNLLTGIADSEIAKVTAPQPTLSTAAMEGAE